MRVLDDRSCYMTALQELLITDLFSLSTSVYTEVCCNGNQPLFVGVSYGVAGGATLEHGCTF